MRRILRGTAALALVLGAVVVSAGPASSAPPPVTWAWTAVGVPDEGCVLGKIDLTTGELTQLPGTPNYGGCVQDLAAGPDGSVWGVVSTYLGSGAAQGSNAPQAVSDIALARFDTTTGEVAGLTPIVLPGDDDYAWFSFGGIAVGADGTVWLEISVHSCASNASCLLTVDPATGVATEIGPSGLPATFTDGLAVCGGGLITLVGDTDAGAGALAFGQDLNIGRVNANTGAVTEGADTPDDILGYDCGGATSGYALVGEGVTFDESLDRLGIGKSTNVGLSTFDPATGDVSRIADIDPAEADVRLLAIPPSPPTPPPTTPTTAAPTTSTTAAAAQPATVTPRFTG